MRGRVLPVGFALRGRWRLTHFSSGPRDSRLFTAAAGAGFIECLFDRFAGFSRSLLNPADQFLGLAFGKLEIVVREFGPFLFQFALGDVPVAFDFKCVHNSEYCFVVCFSFAVNATAKVNGVRVQSQGLVEFSARG
jgi:hypothetical protein